MMLCSLKDFSQGEQIKELYNVRFLMTVSLDQVNMLA